MGASCRFGIGHSGIYDGGKRGSTVQYGYCVQRSIRGYLRTVQAVL